jgi:hypothetical protein
LIIKAYRRYSTPCQAETTTIRYKLWLLHNESAFTREIVNQHGETHQVIHAPLAQNKKRHTGDLVLAL